MSSTQPSNNGNTGKIILIVIFILLLAGVNVYQFLHGKKEAERYEGIITDKQTEIDEQLAQLDSLETELKMAYDSITALGGENEELRLAIEEISAERDKYKASDAAAWRKVRSLQRRINKYEAMLRESDQRIAELKATNDSLHSENNGLKGTIATQQDSIENYKGEISERDEIIATARELQSSGFKFTAISEKGKEKTKQPFKTKALDKLKIEFKLEENKVALMETKEVFIQIKDPNNNTIYDLDSGSGTFEVEGKEQYYTIKNEVLYDQSGTEVIAYFKKGSPFEAGNHTVTIYCEGVIVGTETFLVK